MTMLVAITDASNTLGMCHFVERRSWVFFRSSFIIAINSAVQVLESFVALLHCKLLYSVSNTCPNRVVYSACVGPWYYWGIFRGVHLAIKRDECNTKRSAFCNNVISIISTARRPCLAGIHFWRERLLVAHVVFLFTTGTVIVRSLKIPKRHCVEDVIEGTLSPCL